MDKFVIMYLIMSLFYLLHWKKYLACNVFWEASANAETLWRLSHDVEL